MIEIDFASPVAIYDQIKTGVRGMIAKGLLRPGDKVPSIRALAVRLSVNPNTVARAVRELTAEGVLESQRGESNYVSEKALLRAKESVEALRKEFAEALKLARRGGLGWQDIESVIIKEKGRDK